MRRAAFTILGCALLLPAGMVRAHDPELLATMVEEAVTLRQLLESGPGIFRQDLAYDLDDESRADLDFVPNEMKVARGATLGIMQLDARRAAHRLLRTALSQEGYLLATSIISLEDVLRGIELWTQARLAGDYAFQVFGQPSLKEPWGWKAEGHHLSVNITMQGEELRGTPLFVGANPAEVRNGPRAGLRVLAPHQDLAVALMESLSDSQKAIVWDPDAPEVGVVQRGEPTLEPGANGIRAGDLSAAQQEILWSLVETYVGALGPSMAHEELQRIEEAGAESLYFHWKGSLDPGQRHYYSIQGPTLVIEFDRIQDGGSPTANHIHAILRDPSRDFGRDLLGDHYRESHQP